MRANFRLFLVRPVAFLCLTAVLVFYAGTSYASGCKAPPGLKGTERHIVKFAINSTEITAKDQTSLKAAAERFKSHPSLQICVLGQSDRTGNADYNKKLAQERAEAVAAYLKESGLADKKFQVVSRGAVFTGSTDSFLGKLIGEDVAADRRVEITFYR
jgi:outer membrane protein OmpA-like peptidoglycan-associated protein